MESGGAKLRPDKAGHMAVIMAALFSALYTLASVAPAVGGRNESLTAEACLLTREILETKARTLIKQGERGVLVAEPAHLDAEKRTREVTWNMHDVNGAHLAFPSGSAQNIGLDGVKRAELGILIPGCRMRMNMEDTG